MSDVNNSVDLSNLAAYPGEFRQDLITEMYNSLNLENEGILVRPNIKSDEILHKLLVKKGAKPYTGKFISKEGDINYEPRTLHVEKAQRDLSVEPSKYIGSYMQYKRGRGENAKNMTIPFAEYMWNAVLQELGTEINLGTVYHGVGKAGFAAFDALAVYNPGDRIKFTQDGELRYFKCVTLTVAGESPDTAAAKWEWDGAAAIAIGFGKIIVDEIAANNLDPVVTGVVDANNAYAKFTAMFRAHTEPVRMGKHGQVITLCSQTDYEALTDDYENKIKKNFEETNGVTYLAKTNKVNIIKPVSWLNGTRRLITTLQNNLVAGTDELSDMNVIKTIEAMYHIDAGITFMFGVQITDLDALRVSDQA